MKLKMWILVNTDKDKIIKIEPYELVYAIGFETRKALLRALNIESIKDLRPEEKVRKIEMDIITP